MKALLDIMASRGSVAIVTRHFVHGTVRLDDIPLELYPVTLFNSEKKRDKKSAT
jgi:hypothetical protein